MGIYSEIYHDIKLQCGQTSLYISKLRAACAGRASLKEIR